MLAMKKDAMEERNSHLKHLAFVFVGAIIIGSLPYIMVTIQGIDTTTGCTDNGECMTEGFFKDAIIENWPNVVFGFALAGTILGIGAGGYKVAQA